MKTAAAPSSSKTTKTSRPPARRSTPPPPSRKPTDSATLSGETGQPQKAGMADAVKGWFSSSPQTTGDKIAAAAADEVGSAFKPTESARCADFVSHVINKSGTQPEGFRPTVRARDFGAMGAERIDPKNLKKGDVVAFNNTWRYSQNPGDHTHVGIYDGNGMMIHRPTNEADYLPGSKPGEVIREPISEYLKRDRGRRVPSVVAGYRFN